MKYPLILQSFFSPVEFILQGSLVNSEKFQGRILSFCTEEFLAEESLKYKVYQNISGHGEISCQIIVKSLLISLSSFWKNLAN